LSDVPVADGFGAVFGAGEGAEVADVGLAGWSAAAVGDARSVRPVLLPP
jgi:hypothetical protein